MTPAADSGRPERFGLRTRWWQRFVDREAHDYAVFAELYDTRLPARTVEVAEVVEVARGPCVDAAHRSARRTYANDQLDFVLRHRPAAAAIRDP